MNKHLQYFRQRGP